MPHQPEAFNPWRVDKSLASGKQSDRPELTRAIDACRKHKAQLVIGKLDRLSRNPAFVATLMDAGVEFVAVDNPHGNKLTIHILAAGHTSLNGFAGQLSARKVATANGGQWRHVQA